VSFDFLGEHILSLAMDLDMFDVDPLMPASGAINNHVVGSGNREYGVWAFPHRVSFRPCPAVHRYPNGIADGDLDRSAAFVFLLRARIRALLHQQSGTLDRLHHAL
jgi:hypothetical protein